MKSAYQVLLVIHVICGFVSLVTGIVPMVVKKGGKAHNFWGTIYYWGMFGVFVTTVGMFSLRPTQLFLQFFLCIAILSFYQTFTGVRALRLKKSVRSATLTDRLAAWLAMTCGAVMMGYAVFTTLQNQYMMAILFAAFGTLIFVNGWNDIRIFVGQKEAQKMHWFFSHLGKMIGSYTATVTAFCVNMSRYYPEGTPAFLQLIPWFVPGIILGIVSARFTKHYRAKLTMKRVPEAVK
ncbi:MAG: hypothetical protein U0Y10_01125 [Spirosomataceae bacterium]